MFLRLSLVIKSPTELKNIAPSMNGSCGIYKFIAISYQSRSFLNLLWRLVFSKERTTRWMSALPFLPEKHSCCSHVPLPRASRSFHWKHAGRIGMLRESERTSDHGSALPLLSIERLQIAEHVFWSESALSTLHEHLKQEDERSMYVEEGLEYIRLLSLWGFVHFIHHGDLDFQKMRNPTVCCPVWVFSKIEGWCP